MIRPGSPMPMPHWKRQIAAKSLAEQAERTLMAAKAEIEVAMATVSAHNASAAALWTKDRPIALDLPTSTTDETDG